MEETLINIMEFSMRYHMDTVSAWFAGIVFLIAFIVGMIAIRKEDKKLKQ